MEDETQSAGSVHRIAGSESFNDSIQAEAAGLEVLVVKSRVISLFSP